MLVLVTQVRDLENKNSVETVCVILQPWQAEWGVYAGQQRTVRNAGKVVDKPDYDGNQDVLQPDLDANIASCLCELATSIYTNQRWNGPYWHPKHHVAAQMPDVGRNIEVRRTRKIDNAIPVFEHEAEKKLQLVQAYIAPEELSRVISWATSNPDDFDYVNVFLTGTVAADVAWKNGWQKYPEKRVCPQKFFLSVTSLCQT